MDTVPECILKEIFKFLAKDKDFTALRVCKQWRKLMRPFVTEDYTWTIHRAEYLDVICYPLRAEFFATTSDMPRFYMEESSGTFFTINGVDCISIDYMDEEKNVSHIDEQLCKIVWKFIADNEDHPLLSIDESIAQQARNKLKDKLYPNRDLWDKKNWKLSMKSLEISSEIDEKMTNSSTYARKKFSKQKEKIKTMKVKLKCNCGWERSARESLQKSKKAFIKDSLKNH